MQKVFRILIVIILAMIAAIIALDYFGFHGSILLGHVADGAIVYVFDTTMSLFQGPDRFTNLMFIGVLSIGLIVAVMAIAYKFIKD